MFSSSFPECDHNNDEYELRKLTDLCSELYCRKCKEVVGFSIDISVFGDMGKLFDDLSDKQIKRKIEGKVTELSDEDKQKWV